MNDAENAALYRAEIEPHLRAAADIVERALADGLNISFNIGKTPNGRVGITALKIAKELQF